MRSSGRVPLTNAEPGTARDGAGDAGPGGEGPNGGGPGGGDPGGARGGAGGHWRRRLLQPARRGVLLVVLALVVESLVVPELVGASKALYLLGTINAGWVAAGTALEGISLFCYAVLTRVMLSHGSVKPSLSRLFRIDLSAAAVAHV